MEFETTAKLAKHMQGIQDTYADNEYDVQMQRAFGYGIRSSQIKALVLYLIEKGVLT